MNKDVLYLISNYLEDWDIYNSRIFEKRERFKDCVVFEMCKPNVKKFVLILNKKISQFSCKIVYQNNDFVILRGDLSIILGCNFLIVKQIIIKDNEITLQGNDTYVWSLKYSIFKEKYDKETVIKCLNKEDEYNGFLKLVRYCDKVPEKVLNSLLGQRLTVLESLKKGFITTTKEVGNMENIIIIRKLLSKIYNTMNLMPLNIYEDNYLCQ